MVELPRSFPSVDALGCGLDRRQLALPVPQKSAICRKAPARSLYQLQLQAQSGA